jgi:hypothetical protein
MKSLETNENSVRKSKRCLFVTNGLLLENICISWWYRNEIDARDKILRKEPGQWRIEGLIACKERREGKYSFPSKFLDNFTK